MKILFASIATIILSALPTLSMAQVLCDREKIAPIIEDQDLRTDKIENVRNALTNYDQFQRVSRGRREAERSLLTEGRYEICGARREDIAEGRLGRVVMEEPDFRRGGGDAFTGFELTSDATGKDIYLVGFEIDIQSEFRFSSPILKVIRQAAGGSVHLRNITIKNADKALLIDSLGNVSVRDLSVLNAETGVTVTGEGPVQFTNTNISESNTGIDLRSNDVKITNSVIHSNKIGISVEAGFRAPLLEKTTIYGNGVGPAGPRMRLDGIYFKGADGWNFRDLRFYDLLDGGFVAISPEEESINYGTRTAYILLPEEIGEDGNVEIFYSECDVPGISRNQACRMVPGASPLTIGAVKMRLEGMLTFELEAEKYKGQDLVAIFTNPTLGSTVISQKFRFEGGHSSLLEDIIGAKNAYASSKVKVVFVETPFDTPTTPGGGLISNPSEENTGDEGSVPTVRGEGAGGSGGGEAIGGCLKHEIVPPTKLDTIPVAIILFIFLCPPIALAGLRHAYAKSKILKKTRDK